LAEVRAELEPATGEALERLLPAEPKQIARTLLDMVREFLEGRSLPRKRGRPRKKA
jgi:hypothetical protein